MNIYCNNNSIIYTVIIRETSDIFSQIKDFSKMSLRSKLPLVVQRSRLRLVLKSPPAPWIF